MQQIQPDPYRAAHKAIRVAMGRLIERVGRTDFADLAAVERVRVELEAVVQLLVTHARIEVQFLDPLLAQHDPSRASTIQRDHASLERHLHEVSGGVHAVDEILGPDGDGDPELARQRGHAFYLALTKFTAEYFEHLADEEENLLPILLQQVDGAVLRDAMARARASVDPLEGAKAVGMMLAAMSHPERVAMLRAPGAEALRVIARLSLDDAEWSALAADLD